MKRFFLICETALLAALLAAVLLNASAQSSSSARPALKPQPTGEPAARARGLIVYRDRCEICHFSNSIAAKIGPGLKGLYQRGKFRDGARPNEASVARWILNGNKDMPPFKGLLTPMQMRDLLAYLKTI